MMEEKNTLMIEACTPPKVIPLAWEVFNAIDSYARASSIIISGMMFSFEGLDKDKLARLAKKWRNIDLTRYEPYIDMYENGLSKLYNKKEKKNG